MCLTHWKTPAVVAIGFLGATLAHQAAADDPPSTRDTKDQLTAKSFTELHKLIVAQPDEYRWDEIPWFTSIWHARKKAAAENKPLLVFHTHGAGFNDPLGNC